MKQLHVKNHFVPESYLKRWKSSDNKLCVYRTLVSNEKVPLWKCHSVSAIAYQKHLYTQIIAGNESDEIETWFDKEFESPAKIVLDKAISDSRLSSEDWEVLIKFLAAQDVRTPARLFEHIKRTEKELPKVLKKITKKLRKIDTKGDWDKLKTNKQDTVKGQFPLKLTTDIEEDAETGLLQIETYAGRSTWLLSIKYLLENTRKVLHSHKWSIVKPALGYSWPTSDNPVVKINYYSRNNYDLKGGWGLKKGNIVFPIGPQHAMFVQVGDRPILKGTRLSEDLTKEFIKLIVENSHRKIFSNEEDMGLTILKKRVVDPDKLGKEKIEMELWHQKNSKMEREYFEKNRKCDNPYSK